jgi:hypothetical protein
MLLTKFAFAFKENAKQNDATYLCECIFNLHLRNQDGVVRGSATKDNDRLQGQSL